MDQLRLFELPHKYILDTSSLLTQKETEKHSKTVLVALWNEIGRSMREGKIVLCSEIYEEVRDECVRSWLSQHSCTVLEIDADVQKCVTRVVNERPDLIDIRRNRSSGDAFLIATALSKDLAIITEESKDSPKKIPQVSEQFGIECMNVIELCIKENWKFA